MRNEYFENILVGMTQDEAEAYLSYQIAIGDAMVIEETDTTPGEVITKHDVFAIVNGKVCEL